MGLFDVTKRLEALEALDALAKPLHAFAHKAIPHGPVKDALVGRWLGHSLHPALTDLAIGSWTSAAALDVLLGEDGARASRLLTGLGTVAAVPTALSGLADWVDTYGADQRVGVAHATGNTLALGAFVGSYLAKRQGRRASGTVLQLLGMGVAVMSAHVGGHLSFARGVGVNHTAFEQGPTEWTTAMDSGALSDGEPAKTDVAGASVLLVRHKDRIFAIDDRCSHFGGPLHEGELENGSVRCPWHGSRFSLEDGSIIEGPAKVPQPCFEVRETEGKIEVRRAG